MGVIAGQNPDGRDDANFLYSSTNLILLHVSEPLFEF
jgi:hypothetical protein